jgi:hypothetical protein
MDDEFVRFIEEKIMDLKRRWLSHSVPPAMFQELEDLEEALEKALAKSRKDQSAEENRGC